MSDIRRGNGDKLAMFLQYSKHVMAIRRELLDLSTHPTANSLVFIVKGLFNIVLPIYYVFLKVLESLARSQRTLGTGKCL